MTYRNWIGLGGGVRGNPQQSRYGLKLPCDVSLPFQEVWNHRGLTIGVCEGKIAGGDNELLITHGKTPTRFCMALDATQGAVLCRYTAEEGMEISNAEFVQGYMFVSMSSVRPPSRWCTIVIPRDIGRDVEGMDVSAAAAVVESGPIHFAEDESSVVFGDGTELVLEGRIRKRTIKRLIRGNYATFVWGSRFILISTCGSRDEGRTLAVHASLTAEVPEWSYTFGHDVPPLEVGGGQAWRMHHLTGDVMIAWQPWKESGDAKRFGVFDVRTGAHRWLTPWIDMKEWEATSADGHLYLAGRMIKGRPPTLEEIFATPAPKKPKKLEPMRLTCYDLATGRVVWQDDLAKGYEDIYALVRMRTQLLVVAVGFSDWQVQVRDAGTGKVLGAKTFKRSPGFGVTGERMICLDGRTVRAYACA